MEFIKRKAVCMFATDIAARGLDFPEVDWVIQADAPEDAAMYIHRVGRTARYNAGGRALLMLLPEEQRTVVKELEEASIPISKLTINTKFKISVTSHAAALLASRPECKELAKKAFTGYIRSLQLLPQRVVDTQSLPLLDFATSLGLPFAPPIPLLMSEEGEGGGAVDVKREEIREKKNVNRSLDRLKKQIKEAKEEKRRQRDAAASQSRSSLTSKTIPEEDDLLVAKSTPMDFDHQAPDPEVDLSSLSRKQRKALRLQKISGDGVASAAKKSGRKKILFDENFVEIENLRLRSSDEMRDEEEKLEEAVDAHLAELKRRIDRTRDEDEYRDKERVRQAHRERKLRVKGPKTVDNETVVLLSGDIDDDDDESAPAEEEKPTKRRKRVAESLRAQEDLILNMFE